VASVRLPTVPACSAVTRTSCHAGAADYSHMAAH
jgi:hypothetical protein